MNLYYDPSYVGSLGGSEPLARATNSKKHDTLNWLQGQRTYTLHKPARKKYITRPYKTGGIDEQWQADLVEMIPYEHNNDGYRYLLTIIDLFSRYAWARALKHKRGDDVTKAFKDVFETSGRKPQRLQTDEGKEFENRTFQHFLNLQNIRFFTVKSQFKAAVAERFNRTLKSKMWRHFTHTGSYRWLEVLPQLIESYNNSVHRSIGIAPINVTEDNEHELWLKQERTGPQRVTQRNPNPRIRIGDVVRISRAKNPFEKGYLPSWTEEIFTVVEILDTKPVQYKLTDYDGELIKGSFYGAEIQKVDKPESFAIERVIRTRQRHGRTEYFVKWRGYGNQFNSWTNDLQAID